MRHDVALIIAAMNAEATIAHAVQSALMQAEASEIFVVDDGSSDRTAEVARGCDDGTGRLTVISLAENRGPSAARNLALEKATATWVGVLDADDFLLPGRLQKLIGTLDGTALPDLLADDLLTVMSSAKTTEPRPMGLLKGAAVLELDIVSFVAGDISDPKRPRMEYGFLKPLMRREFLYRYGLQYDVGLRLAEDYILYATALAHGAKFRLVPACGYVAVVHPGSLSHQHRTEDIRMLVAAEDRLLTSPGLSPAAIAVLETHRRTNKHRFLHRAMLDAKQQGEYFKAFQCLFNSAAVARYILAATIRAKTARVLARWGHA